MKVILKNWLVSNYIKRMFVCVSPFLCYVHYFVYAYAVLRKCTYHERAYEEWNYVSRGFRISHWLLSERVPAWLTVYLNDLASAGFVSSPASLLTYLIIQHEWGSECPNGCVSDYLILSHASFNFVLKTALMAQWRWSVLIVLIIYWCLCNRKTERECFNNFFKILH